MTAMLHSSTPAINAHARGRGRGSWRPLWRMARRDVRRRPWRTLLIVLLLALPTAGMMLISTTVRTNNLTPSEEVRMTIGNAAAVSFDGPEVPGGSPAVVLDRAWTRVGAGDRRTYVSLIRGDIANPILEGVYAFPAGRAPAGADEAAISESSAKRMGVGIGNRVELRRLDRAVTIVGFVQDRRWVSNELLVTAPTFDIPSAWMAAGQVTRTAYYSDLADLPEDRTPFETRDQMLANFGMDDSAFSAITMMYVAGIVALAVLGVVITAAFSAGARRQLRELGLAGASGANPRQLRRSLALQGTATGIIGVAVGMVLCLLALMLLAAFNVHLYQHTGSRQFSLFDFAGIAALVITASTLAAWIPARSTAKTPLLAALAGRRPLPPVTYRLPLAGLLLAAAGVAGMAGSVAGTNGDGSVYLAALSGVAVLIGGTLCCPWIIGLFGRLSARASGTTKLVARDLARQRTRTGPLVAAIMATAGGTLVAITLIGTELRVADREERAQANLVSFSSYRVGTFAETVEAPQLAPPAIPAASIEAVRSIVPDAGMLRLLAGKSEIGFEGEASGFPTFVLIVNPDDMRAFGFPDAADALDRGEAAVFRPAATEVTPPTLRFTTFEPGGGNTPLGTVAAIVFPWDDRLPDRGQICTDERNGGCHPAPHTYVTPSALGLDPSEFETHHVHFRLAQPLTAEQADQLEELGETLADRQLDERVEAGEPTDTFVEYSISFQRPGGVSSGTILLYITVGGILLTLGVMALGLALGAVEQRDEDTALIAVGAPPRVRRTLRAKSAGLLALCGTALALPIGLIPAYITYHGAIGRWPEFPLVAVLVVLVALPLLAATGGWLFTRTPRRVDLSRIS